MSSSMFVLETAHIHRLPEELLVHILSYLDTATPPSQANVHKEPSNLLTHSPGHVYKDLSLVSHRWRRLVLPLLFRFTRLHLRSWPDNLNRKFALGSRLAAFLEFVRAHELASVAKSIVVIQEATTLPRSEPYGFPSDASRLLVSFWHHLLSVLDLARVAIVAPPAYLATLTSCAVETRDAWAFGDMKYHTLDLQLDHDSQNVPSPFLGKPVDFSTLDCDPHTSPGIAEASILRLRPWSRFTINEGCFLTAYGTYEFFERGPPSVLPSILDCFMPRSTYSASLHRISHVPLASLRKLTYIAIFPFATHLYLRSLLPQLEELELQLAPLQDSRILDQRSRVGRADLQDCWAEMFCVYRDLAAQLATFHISRETLPRLKRFVCRDVTRPALRAELDETFITLCMPVWAECEPGVFTRLRDSIDVEGV